jgi:hypothetical protein
MTITIYPCEKKADSFRLPNRKVLASTAQTTFKCSFNAVHGREGRVEAVELSSSSFSHEGVHDPNVVPISNGFVETLMEAYSRHRMLVIRPDDVWMAILTQFNFFVNANAESLGGSFVSHEGQKELHLEYGRLDVNSVAQTMTGLLHKNITDPSIREWIIPNFSTTIDLDKTTTAIIMMSTFQKYFACLCQCAVFQVLRWKVAGQIGRVL